jgi:TPR repeat protein
VRAAVWIYQTVADVGGAYAAYRLGLIQSEEGDHFDRDKAFKNFTAAADAGCLPAMVELARCYKDGRGTVADAAKAKEWAKKAADEGNADAKALLEEWK